MKKTLCLTLAFVLLFSFASCGKSNTEGELAPEENIENVIDTAPEENITDEAPEEDKTPASDENTAEQKPADDKKPQAPQKPADDKKPAENTTKPQTPDTPAPQEPATPPASDNTPSAPPAEEAPSQSSDTMGSTMLGIWRANRDKSPEEIANACISHDIIQFMAATMPVEPGYFAEFGGEIDGFTSGVKFGPMMGSIAFSGFVFEVSGDANAFAKKLRDSADPRWNICVEAEETVCEVFGNKVFFLMCPKSLAE